MSFAQGHPILAIPGPSPVPDRVLRAMHRASPDIYGAEMAQENLDLMRRLRRLAGSSGQVASYIGNGHAGWEAANCNMFDRGDRALVLCSGHFGRGWAASARALGVDVEEMDFGPAAPDPQRLAERLAQDREARIRAVLVCQIDTASSVRADIAALRPAMGDHPALLAVDAIASLGCEPLHMDEWGIDVLVSASQKGLMTPPGVALVWVSERARARPRTDLATPYWDWTPRLSAEALWQFWGGTPPVQHIFGLNEALRMLLDEETLPAAWTRHEGLARATWAAIEAWGAQGTGIAAMVADRGQRARSVTAASLPGATALREWAARNAGVTLGIGLGADDPDNALRIAHMGYANAPQVLGTLAVMQAGMAALKIPHGTGALERAADQIAAGQIYHP
ncbi:alanine-glyoxylate transaminase / serine-glyoxylate transaminase / serine-pyruvate transaminase [Paracoccus halophilus]|uniref:Alanine-glyoxylate transaminase / serine-glyoxylate transaminase / serine-pyruvate transaminase n=1 Tax=Paracoccus halophilus TaxID=376733 RepID=A0A099F5X9_9RHOB|nr:aminotransferase class V-fold PLP-dependent enzyme [Paracoccus halophilus]KGJ05864.1 septum site-determining protein [Paracoccus halophilus]SFA40630.1 alanine-glyoxylate transaminase / serine-glyoxylate transaminase / serine-pyruvate transaminase [Paracoccus halophilus]